MLQVFQVVVLGLKVEPPDVAEVAERWIIRRGPACLGRVRAVVVPAEEIVMRMLHPWAAAVPTAVSSSIIKSLAGFGRV